MVKTVPAPRHPEAWRPEIKGGHSFRFRNDTWDDAEDAIDASAAENDTEWVKEAIEARLSYVRCERGRCGQAVPIRFGNLGGGPLDPWIALAVRVVRGQKCGAHEPVTVGIDQ